MNCKNCGHSVEGNFCSQCGQNAKIERINFPNFLREMSEGIFQVNRGFFYTLTELFVRPGLSIGDFLNGKRKNHFKPIAYVLTLSTVYFLIAQFTNQNTWMNDLVSGWINGATEKNSEAEIPKFISWFLKNYTYSTLLLLPIFSIASYLSFFKFGKNYLEHIIVNSYITGQQAFFYSLFTIIGALVKSELLGALPFITSTLYTFWVYWQLFRQENRIINFLRSILTYFLYLLFCTVLLVGLIAMIE